MDWRPNHGPVDGDQGRNSVYGRGGWPRRDLNDESLPVYVLQGELRGWNQAHDIGQSPSPGRILDWIGQADS